MINIADTDLSAVATLAELIEATAAADGRNYLAWPLVYLFVSHLGIKLSGIANGHTAATVMAAGFDPYTANIGHADTVARFEAQIAG